MRLYGYGQVLDSDRAIDGAIPADSTDAPGIVIRHHPPAAAAPADTYVAGGDGMIFTSPLAGAYRCRPDAIAVTPHLHADPAEVAAMLIATALPAALWLQGRYVLHAAAVRLPGRAAAIAIAGPSGIGKSTLAAALVARGAALLADDSVALDDDGLASGLPGGLFEPDGAAGRRFVGVPAPRRAAPARLAALLVLSRGEGEWTRLDRLAAVRELLVQRHRPRVPDVLGRQREILSRSTLLSALFPVYAVPRRAGAVALEEREWRAIDALSQRTEPHDG